MRDGYSNNVWSNNIVSYCGNGIHASHGSNNNIWRGNHITHTIEYAAYAGLGSASDGHALGTYRSQGTIFESNYCAFGDAAVVALDQADAIVRYNEIHSYGKTGYPGIALSVNLTNAGDTVDIYYNKIVGEQPNGVGLTTGVTNGKVNILNNTFVMDAASSGLEITHGANVSLKNNLFYNNGSTWNLIRYTQASTGVVSDYNLFYNKKPATNYVTSTTNYYATLAAWTAASSQDANSLFGDPNVVSFPTDLQLQTGSSAINAGVNVGLTHDILGNPIVGNPDIGAYESPEE
jgi:hypothetical protein